MNHLVYDPSIADFDFGDQRMKPEAKKDSTNKRDDMTSDIDTSPEVDRKVKTSN